MFVYDRNGSFMSVSLLCGNEMEGEQSADLLKLAIFEHTVACSPLRANIEDVRQRVLDWEQLGDHFNALAMMTGTRLTYNHPSLPHDGRFVITRKG